MYVSLNSQIIMALIDILALAPSLWYCALPRAVALVYGKPVVTPSFPSLELIAFSLFLPQYSIKSKFNFR